MKLYSVSEYIRYWDTLSCNSGVAICGAVLCLGKELLLMEERVNSKFYKDNKRVVLDYPGAHYELNKVLPTGAGGASPFWEAAVVSVEKSRFKDGRCFVTPSLLQYRNYSDNSFVKLHVDQQSILDEQQEDLNVLCRAETDRLIEEAGEFNPFKEPSKRREIFIKNIGKIKSKRMYRW